MMATWFSALSHAVEGTPAVALTAAAIWGILGILLSPCHLASIPLIVGFVGEQGRISTRRAFTLSLLFSTGILATIALIGVLTAAAGRMMGDLGPYANYAVAVIFFVVGLHLLGVIPLPISASGPGNFKRKGLLAALILGLVFGLALGPCTFAYMAPMLAITFKVSSAQPLYAALLLLAYGVGHCGVIVLAGTSTELVEHLLRWNNRSRGTVWLKRICGVLVILGGLWLLYTAP
jgi:cytochrome c-type biogenesis protein